MRRCRACGRHAVAHPKHWYCGACRPLKLAEQARRRGQRFVPAAEAGYGAEHQRLRRLVRKLIDQRGGLCSRCGGYIAPGDPFDLGHDDFDRSRYTGPEHPRCNRATAGRKKVAPSPSRVW